MSGQILAFHPELPTSSTVEILHKLWHARNLTHHDMNNRICQLLFILISCICAVSHSLGAQTPEPGKPTPGPGKQKEFIYVLRPVPRLYDDKNWTKEDTAALHQHFMRFQEATKFGQVILAGRTQEPGEKTLALRFLGQPMKQARGNLWRATLWLSTS